MRILCDNNGCIVAVGPICEFGYWEDEPHVQKWKIDEHYYALDYGYTAYDVENIPDEYYKYLFLNGEFVKNPNYTEPPKSDAERIKELEETVAIHEENDAELLYQICLLQLGITEEDVI